MGTEQPGECSGLGCPIKLLTELVSWVGVFPVACTYLVLVAVPVIRGTNSPLVFVYTLECIFVPLELCHTCFDKVMASLSRSQRGEKEREVGICCCGYLFRHSEPVSVMLCNSSGVADGWNWSTGYGVSCETQSAVLGQIKSLPFSSPAKEHGLIISLTSG